MLIYVLFFIFPSVNGFYLAFTDWSMARDIGSLKFVGLENFRIILDASMGIRSSITNTLYIAAWTTVLKNVIGLALAVGLVRKSFRSKNMLRGVFFLPAILPPLIIGIIFTSVFKPNNGLFNNILVWFGMGAFTKAWLAETAAAFGAIIAVETWRQAGFHMAIYIAGLQVIPEELYESADIDGAGSWQKLVFITIPQLLPSLTVNLILSLISGLKIFEIVYSLTNSGPGGTTAVMLTEVFDQFSKGRYALSSALGVIMFMIVAVIVMVVYGFVQKKAGAHNE